MKKVTFQFLLNLLLFISAFVMMKISGFSLVTFFFFFFFIFTGVLLVKSFLHIVDYLESMQDSNRTAKAAYLFLLFLQICIGIILIGVGIYLLVLTSERFFFENIRYQFFDYILTVSFLVFIIGVGYKFIHKAIKV
jgi:hypothetical protein